MMARTYSEFFPPQRASVHNESFYNIPLLQHSHSTIAPPSTTISRLQWAPLRPQLLVQQQDLPTIALPSANAPRSTNFLQRTLLQPPDLTRTAPPSPAGSLPSTMPSLASTSTKLSHIFIPRAHQRALPHIFTIALP